MQPLCPFLLGSEEKSPRRAITRKRDVTRTLGPEAVAASSPVGSSAFAKRPPQPSRRARASAIEVRLANHGDLAAASHTMPRNHDGNAQNGSSITSLQRSKRFSAAGVPVACRHTLRAPSHLQPQVPTRCFQPLLFPASELNGRVKRLGDPIVIRFRSLGRLPQHAQCLRHPSSGCRERLFL